MKESLINDQLDALRARIETTVAAPGVVTVTSAERGDGTTLVAIGLADRFAEARYRVLFVDANTGSPSLTDLPAVTNIAQNPEDVAYPIRSIAGRYDAISLADPQLASKTQREALGATVRSFRATYDYVLIDTGAMANSAFSTLFAGESDATLMTLRAGRNATENDQQAVAALERAEAVVIGVVPTHRDAQKNFDKTLAKLNASSEPAVKRTRVSSLPKVSTVLGEQNGKPMTVPSVSAERS